VESIRRYLWFMGTKWSHPVRDATGKYIVAGLAHEHGSQRSLIGGKRQAMAQAIPAEGMGSWEAACGEGLGLDSALSASSSGASIIARFCTDYRFSHSVVRDHLLANETSASCWRSHPIISASETGEN